MTIADTIKTLSATIEKARSDSPLSARHITVMGASKGQGEPLLRQAIEAGLTDFGENRVQEAETKWPGLRKAYPSVTLHLIGPLQTNKVREALGLFDVIQTIDRKKLADAIAKELTNHRIIESSNHRFFIQVNTGREEQKAGVLPEETDTLIDYCRSQLHLPLAGLMCIPPIGQPPAPHFSFLRSLAVSHGLSELSMGMSEDYETAVKMGSTCVRIGRALFGERL